MTDPAPSTPPAAPTRTPPPPPSWLTKMRLSEPARLYLYTLGGVGLAGLAAAGVLTHDWIEYGSEALAVLLGVPVATEAVRASVYSPAGTVAAIRQAALHHDQAARPASYTMGPATAMFRAVRQETDR